MEGVNFVSLIGHNSGSWIWGDELRMFSCSLIMIDCPWRFETWSDAGKVEKAAEAHYNTMSIAEIKSLPVGHLAGKDCVLWMWATNPMIDQQIDVCRHWGFKFATMGTWVKRTVEGKLAFGTGYRLRCASEPFIIGINGNPKTLKNVRTVIEGPIREHSRKPDEAYAEAERMVLTDGLRADIFSREQRSGWINFGDERGLFNEGAETKVRPSNGRQKVKRDRRGGGGEGGGLFSSDGL